MESRPEMITITNTTGRPRRLKPAYQDLFEEFIRNYGDSGCYCRHLGNPPCSWCTHAGNPSNLAENEDAWENWFVAKVRDAAEAKKLDLFE